MIFFSITINGSNSNNTKIKAHRNMTTLDIFFFSLTRLAKFVKLGNHLANLTYISDQASCWQRKKEFFNFWPSFMPWTNEMRRYLIINFANVIFFQFIRWSIFWHSDTDVWLSFGSLLDLTSPRPFEERIKSLCRERFTIRAGVSQQLHRKKYQTATGNM